MEQRLEIITDLTIRFRSKELERLFHVKEQTWRQHKFWSDHNGERGQRFPLIHVERVLKAYKNLCLLDLQKLQKLEDVGL